MKDVGMIPKMMADFFEYDSFIFCQKLTNLGKNDFSTVNFVKIRTMWSKSNDSGSYGVLNLLNQIRLLSTSYDKVVVNFYHYKRNHLYLAALSKLFFKNVFFYVKLDLNNTDRSEQFEPSNKLNKVVRDYLIKYIDLFTVETTEVFESFERSKAFSNKVHYLPNGVYLPEGGGFDGKLVDEVMERKENVILFSARLDAYQKNTNLMVNSFLYSKLWQYGWQLKLSGDTKHDILNFVDEKYKYLLNSGAKMSMSFLGYLNSKDLFQQMQAAKLFALSSRYESFGLVLVEAAANGCVLVGTNVGAISDITQKGKFGYLADEHTVESLSKALVSAANNENLAKLAKLQMNFVVSNFDWKNICKKLENMINEKN